MALRTLNELVGPADFVWDECEPRSKPLTQRGGDVFLVAHHSVSRTLQSILETFHSQNRSVSGTVATGPLVAGQDAYQQRHTVPWNTHRPYTTSSWIDDKAFTFEMANLALTPPYPVGSTGKSWLVEVIAAMHVELGMPMDRWHVTCHSEVYQRGWDSYPTACCGDDLRGFLDQAVREAIALVARSKYQRPKDSDDMIIYIARNSSADGVIASGTIYIQEGNGPLRRIDRRLEFGVYEFWADPSKVGNDKVLPYRKAEWTGDEIRSLTKDVGLYEITNKQPTPYQTTGRIVYSDPKNPMTPPAAATVELTPEQLQKIVDALKGSLAADIVAALAVPTAVENAEAVANELHTRLAE